MPGYFPRHTIESRAIERKSVRRLTVSLLEMALITGVVVRVLRALAYTSGSGNLLFLGAMFALGAVVLLGMLAAHLSNFTLRRWVWRAPLFAVIESMAEICVSAILIAARLEPLGTQRAEFHDWLSMAAGTVWSRFAVIVAFAILLAGVVTLTRRVMLSRTRDRDSRATLQDELYRETPG